MKHTIKQLMPAALLSGAFCFGAADCSAQTAGVASESFGYKLAPLAAVQLMPSDGVTGDNFGYAVALSADGNTALVGAPLKMVGTAGSQGSIYLFVRSGSGWAQQAELRANNGAAGDRFGWAVALSADGNTALVGAPHKANGTQTAQGSAYVFVRSGTNWQQQLELKARDAAAGDNFGCSVALSGDGDTALVGAALKTFGTRSGQGSAYLFTRNGTGWAEQTQLTPNDGSANDEFGCSVALSADGNTALVGAPFKLITNPASTETGQGCVYFFVRNSAGWHPQAQQTPSDPGIRDAYGFAVALSADGNTALVGAVAKASELHPYQGSAYVLVRTGGTWNQEAKLLATDGAAQDGFGVSVSLSADGNTALIGSYPLHDYVFVRTGGSWTQQSEVVAGRSVSLSSDANTALAGAPDTGPGTVYVLGATYSLAVSASPADAGIVGGGGTFAAGSAQLVTAQANPGYAFTNWTENGVAVSAMPNYAFTLEGDRTLVANFVALAVTNVMPVKGTYRGLLSAAGDPAQRSSGCFTLTTTAQGTFSASFTVGGTKYSSRGCFDSFGCCTQTLRSAKMAACGVHLQLSAADPDQLYGTVSAPDGSWSAALAGDRAVYHPVTNSAPQAGKYTLVIPGTYGSMHSAANAWTGLPGGDGYGTVKVDVGGKLKLSGSLADGTSLSHSSALSKDGQWPLYVRLHSGKGSLQGWITFAPAPSNDLSGTLAWIKPPLPDAKYYPAGFSLQTMAPGFRYIPPAKGMPLLNLSQAVLVLSGDGLPQNLSNYVTLNPNNRVTGTNKLSLSFTPSTGAFRGSVPGVATDGKTGKISFRGVVVQATNSAQGYFLGTGGQSGEVLFGAP